MAKTTTSDPVHDYLSSIGRKGGIARVKKGVGTLTPEQRKEHASMMAKARWDAYRKAHPKKKAATGKKKAGK